MFYFTAYIKFVPYKAQRYNSTFLKIILFVSTSFEFGNICVYSATLRPDNSSLSEEIYNDKILINIVLTQEKDYEKVSRNG